MKRTNRFNLPVIVVEIITALLILLFVYTASNKLNHHIVFADVLRQSPVIGNGAVIMSWAVPTVELIIAAGLFSSSFRLAGLYAALILVSAFTFYIIFMLTTTSHLPCSCGGFLEHLTWKQHLLFNGLVILGCMAGVFFQTYYGRAGSSSKRQLNF